MPGAPRYETGMGEWSKWGSRVREFLLRDETVGVQCARLVKITTHPRAWIFDAYLAVVAANFLPPLWEGRPVNEALRQVWDALIGFISNPAVHIFLFPLAVILFWQGVKEVAAAEKRAVEDGCNAEEARFSEEEARKEEFERRLRETVSVPIKIAGYFVRNQYIIEQEQAINKLRQDVESFSKHIGALREKGRRQQDKSDPLARIAENLRRRLSEDVRPSNFMDVLGWSHEVALPPVDWAEVEPDGQGRCYNFVPEDNRAYLEGHNENLRAFRDRVDSLERSLRDAKSVLQGLANQIQKEAGDAQVIG